MASIYSLDSSIIVGGVAVLSVFVWAISFRFGSRRSRRQAVRTDSQSQAIEAAILTIFALLLGFTFSMSAGRFEARRSILLEESNAIGTAYLRASLLDSAPKAQLQRILREYLDARIAHYRAPFDSGSVTSLKDESARLERSAFALAAEETRRAPTPANALVISALNAVIDVREKQTFAFENVVPETILGFLLALSLIAVVVIGFLNGLAATRQTFLCMVFAGVSAMTIFLVLDLDRPRRGPIHLGVDTLLRLKASIAETHS